jgi:hypothetical protein
MWYANINAFLMGFFHHGNCYYNHHGCKFDMSLSQKKRFLIILSMMAISTAKLNSLEKESDLYVNGNL